MRTHQFLTTFSLCALLTAMAGCTDENPLTGTDAGGGETDTPVTLTIRTTMTDFAGLPEPDASSPASTRATNSGNTTTFVAGDQIGIYAVKENGKIFGGIENIPLTYEVGSDGITGQWKAPEGVEFYYLPKVMYFAYYPYEAGLPSGYVTLNPGSPETFGPALAESSRFTPKLDQSTSGYYARYDLMTAYGKPVPTAEANPAERVLDLDFRHQHAVFILVPSTEMFCIPPDEDLTYYTYNQSGSGDMRVSVTDTKVTSVTMIEDGWGGEPKPCKMEDGSYRMLLSINKLGSNNLHLSGTYNTTKVDGASQTIKWSGTPIKNIKAGKSYILRVFNDRSALAGKDLERRVAPGDYVCFDYDENIIVLPGNSRNADFTKAIGIVVTSDPTDNKLIENGWTHACVMPIMPPLDLFDVTWDKHGDEPLSNLTTYNDVRNDISGYTSTETMTNHSNYGGYMGYEFLQRLKQMRDNDSEASRYPKIPSLPPKTTCSPWFIPTTGQWREMMINLGEIPLDKVLTGPSYKNLLDDEEGWINEYPAAKAWERINERLAKVNADAKFPDARFMYMCCSEVDEHRYWSAVIGGGALGFQKSTKGVDRAYLLPFFAF